jgi:hypothetical protein
VGNGNHASSSNGGPNSVNQTSGFIGKFTESDFTEADSKI